MLEQKKHFKKCPNLSIDVAVMEKIQNIGCYKYQKHWADLGDWKNVSDNSRSDLLIESQNSLVIDSQEDLLPDDIL